VLKEIRDAKDVLRGRDSKGIPFLQHVFKLHKKIFNEACSNCPHKLQGYINNLKKFNPQKQKIMSNQKRNFELKTGVIVPVAGTSESYSNANLTDEKAVELLTANPNRKALFSKLPKNIDELIEDFKNKSSQKSDDDSKELVKIGDYSLTVEETEKVLDTAKIKTRAKTVTGLQKFVNELKEEEQKEVFQLAKSLVEAKDVETGQDDRKGFKPDTDSGEKTLEELQFDLEKAEQDLEDLKANNGNPEALSQAEKTISELTEQIENLSK